MDNVVTFVPTGAANTALAPRAPAPGPAEAAISEASRPEITPPAPASLNQQAEVARARIVEELPGARAVKAPERVLKPFGVAMLPEGPVETDSSGPDDDGEAEMAPTGMSQDSAPKADA